jgi:hypothetical protein
LAAIYTPHSAGNFALPPGWQWDLDFVVPGKSVSFNGQSFAIDPNWEDSQHYKEDACSPI